jgi:hypothetical protein
MASHLLKHDFSSAVGVSLLAEVVQLCWAERLTNVAKHMLQLRGADEAFAFLWEHQ